ncbi:MAG: SDR family oxidoreductase [Acidobacteria bacterium]|nr:SDR family oxidoreductase [Acidobacteriota bacterium]
MTNEITAGRREGRLRGKVAIITGGARGMGAAHARAMVGEGASVVLGDVLDHEGREIADRLGPAATYVHLDVTDRGDWASAVATAIDTYGHLDVLVNNAGIVNFGALEDYTQDEWNDIMAVNVTGAFNGISIALHALKAGAPSSIINISSTAGLKGYSGLAGYTTSKFALRGLTKAVALELAADGVRCNSVHPGAVDTPMIAGVEIDQRHVAMHRIGTPEELANLVVFLASDESSFSTGSEFVADGGETAGLAPDVLSFSALRELEMQV